MGNNCCSTNQQSSDPSQNRNVEEKKGSIVAISIPGNMSISNDDRMYELSLIEFIGFLEHSIEKPSSDAIWNNVAKNNREEFLIEKDKLFALFSSLMEHYIRTKTNTITFKIEEKKKLKKKHKGFYQYIKNKN